MSDQHPTSSGSWPDSMWHNLFYDLAFVAAIIVLSTSFSFDYTVSTAVWIAVVFGVFWSIWLITSLVMNQMPVGPMRVGLVAVQMGFVLAAAVGAGEAVQAVLEFTGPLIGAALLAVAALIAAGWRSEGDAKRRRDALLMAAAGVAFGLGWMIPGGMLLIPFSLVAVAVVTLSMLRHTQESAHTLTHRFGELTMVVLGETFVKVGLSDDSNGLSRFRVSALVLIMLLITAMWLAYFAVVPRGDAGGSGRRRISWALLHLPLHLGLVFLAVGLAKLLADSKSLLHGGITWLLLVPLALTTAALTGLALVGSGRRGRLAAECLAGATVVVAAVAIAAPMVHALTPMVATWCALLPILGAVAFLKLRLDRHIRA